MVLHYQDLPFKYEPSPADLFVGRLLLNDDEKAWLERLEAQNDGWYLDEDGERLPPEELFKASPWSWRSPSGVVKLLCRFFDCRTRETRFNILEEYGGGLYDWLRKPKGGR